MDSVSAMPDLAVKAMLVELPSGWAMGWAMGWASESG
jgi:hypothetical protein